MISSKNEGSLDKMNLMRVETSNHNALSKISNNTKEFIKNVEQFCYLGSAITEDGDAKSDIKSRISKVRYARSITK